MKLLVILTVEEYQALHCGAQNLSRGEVNIIKTGLKCVLNEESRYSKVDISRATDLLAQLED